QAHVRAVGGIDGDGGKELGLSFVQARIELGGLGVEGAVEQGVILLIQRSEVVIARPAVLKQLQRGVERRVNGNLFVGVGVDVAQVVELLAVHVRAEQLQRVAGGLGVDRAHFAPLVRGVGSVIAEVVVK